MISNIFGLDKETIVESFPTVYASGAHESRSARYLYISTGDILDVLRGQGFVPTAVMAAGTRKHSHMGFEKHLIRMRRVCDLGPVADVHEIVLINSHDGTSSYQLMSGLFRLVCSNGCIFGDIQSTIKLMHKGRTLEDVVEGTYKVVEGSVTYMDEVEAMKAIPLSKPEQMLLSEFALSARYKPEEDSVPVPYRPEDFLRPRRRVDLGNALDGGRSLYTTYQVLQENHIKGGISRRDTTGKRHTTRAVNGIDETVRINRLLWQFAKVLLEMKG